MRPFFSKADQFIKSIFWEVLRRFSFFVLRFSFSRPRVTLLISLTFPFRVFEFLMAGKRPGKGAGEGAEDSARIGRKQVTIKTAGIFSFVGLSCTDSRPSVKGPRLVIMRIYWSSGRDVFKKRSQAGWPKKIGFKIPSLFSDF